jgi:TonB family protein
MGSIIVITLLAAQAGTGADPQPISVHIEETLLSTTATRPASPRGNPGNWANANDYPSRSLRDEQEGVTRFRLIVNVDGRASHCEVRESSGSLALDQATCTTIKRRARFNVALDDSGKPIEGNWSSAVRWQIPGRDAPRLSGIATVRTFVVTAEGGLAKCGKGVPDYPPPGSDQACDPTLAYVPFRDAKGQPVARQVMITTTRSIVDAE